MKNNKIKKVVSLTLVLAICFVFAAACNDTREIDDADIALADSAPDMNSEEVIQGLEDLQNAIDEVAVPGSESEEMEVQQDELPEGPAIPEEVTLMASADGTVVHGNEQAEIDASNMADGYIMIRYKGTGTNRIKILIDDPTGFQYQYDLKTDGSYEIFPLTGGNGNYSVSIYQHVAGTEKSYSVLYKTSLGVQLKNEFAPFLQPNQFVNYTATSLGVREAANLVGGETDVLKKVEILYNYMVTNFTYDYDRAANLKSGYIPDLDDVFNKKSGICFDYAALLTAMLRSQNIPTKMIFGYVGEDAVYHAWINVYSESEGWINAAIFFDGKQWKLMDPTFASTAQSSAYIMQYIGDGTNYTYKCQY